MKRVFDASIKQQCQRGLGIGWADANSTIIRLEATKIITRSNEKPLLIPPMITIKNSLQIKDFSKKTID